MNALQVVKMTTKTILLIHKDPNIREVIHACLTDLGAWNVRSASSTLEGLQQATLDQPDAIILEVSLNDIEGLLFLKQLKKQPETEKIPLVLLALRAKWDDLQQSWFKRYQVKIVNVNPLDLAEVPVKIANSLGWNLNLQSDRNDDLYS